MAPATRLGSFIFKWEHPADEVYVTGSFDDWSKSERLNKINNIFTKEVILPIASDKIYYKFVVDGNWVTDHTAPHENDESGNLNNVLTVDKIKFLPSESIGTMSGVTADSSTISLAGAVPLVKDQKYESTTLPGAFPVTPGTLEKDESDFSTRPVSIPELSDIRTPIDEEASTSVVNSTNDLQTKKDEKSQNEQIYSVSPLPAFPGAVNPITIAPGEKLPDYSTLTSNTLLSSVELNNEKYSQDKNSVDTPPFINPASNSQEVNDINDKASTSETSKGTGLVTILPIYSETTEDLPINPFIQSVGPQSTTAILASGVPINNLPKQPHEKTHTIDSQINPVSGVLRTEKDLISTPLNQAPADSFTLKSSFSPNPESELPELSKELQSTSENTHGIIKNPTVDPEQILEPSTGEEAISSKKELPTEDSSSSGAPQNSVDPIHIQDVPQYTATTSGMIDTNEKNTTSNPTQDMCPCSSSVLNQSDTQNIESTANDKSGKKKKRLSIFGKLKAKLTSKDKD